MAVERVPGVIEAKFSYDDGSGIVTYRTEETDPGVFLGELEDKTGFVARVVEAKATTPGEEDTHER